MTVDLQDLRADPGLFSKEFFGVDLLPWQRDLILAQERYVVACCGRSSGKSVASSLKALWESFRRRDYKVLIVSGSHRQSKEQIGATVNRLLDRSDLGGSVVQRSTEKITLSNGSVIHILPTGQGHRLRGYHAELGEKPGGILVIADEFCYMDRWSDVWSALEFILLGADPGQFWACGTPTSTNSGPYRDLWTYCEREDETDFAGFNVPSTANRHVPKEEIEKIAKRLPPDKYKAEILGQWVSDFGSWFAGVLEPTKTSRFRLGEPVSFTQEELQNGWREAPEDHPDISTAYVPNVRLFVTGSAIGVDRSCSWGGGRDRTAVGCVSKVHMDGLAQPFYVLSDLRSWDKVSDAEILKTIEDIEAAQRTEQGCVRAWVLEQYQAAGLAESLQSGRHAWRTYGRRGRWGSGIRIEHASAPRQIDVFSALHEEMAAGRFLIPQAPETAKLLQEMQVFGFEVTESGSIRFGKTAGRKKAGVHDDRVYAVAWAYCGARDLNVRVLPE